MLLGEKILGIILMRMGYGYSIREVRAFSKVGESVFVAGAKSSSDSFAFLEVYLEISNVERSTMGPIKSG